MRSSAGSCSATTAKRFLARLAPAPAICPGFGQGDHDVDHDHGGLDDREAISRRRRPGTTTNPTTSSTTADTSSTSSTTIEATTSSTTSEPTTSTTDTVTTTTEATTTTTLGCVADVGTFQLGFQSGGGEPLALSLDRASINGLIPAAEQRTLVVRDVSHGSLSLRATALKNAARAGA